MRPFSTGATQKISETEQCLSHCKRGSTKNPAYLPFKGFDATAELAAMDNCKPRRRPHSHPQFCVMIDRQNPLDSAARHSYKHSAHSCIDERNRYIRRLSVGRLSDMIPAAY